MAKTKIETINALAELERIGWDFEPAGNDEVRCRCPAHSDKTPSVNLNTTKNKWLCHASSCNARGDIVTFIALALKSERGPVLIELGTRYDLEDIKTINPQNVEKMHAEVFKSGPLLQALRDRGVTDEMIYEARLGFFKGRITIPVYDKNRNVVNIRRYLPGAPGNTKMQNTKGYGSPRLYQVDQLDRGDKVWICAGEMKALVVGALLEEHEIGAIAVTAGEGSWNSLWTPLFEGKTVYVCMDTDVAGTVASRKIATALGTTPKQVLIIKLPLDKRKYPKGDVNDYVGQEGATAEDLLRLMEEAGEYKPGATQTPLNEDAIETTLAQATSPKFVGRRIQVEAVAQAIDTAPYLVPHVVGVHCDRQQQSCHLCPISSMEMHPDDGRVDVQIPAISEGILDLIASPKSKQRDTLRAIIGIPRCRSVSFHARKHFRVDEVRLAPQISIASEGRNNVVQTAFTVNRRIDLNTPYLFRGVVYPHPKTQQAAFLINDSAEAEDTLNSFDIESIDPIALEVFRPEEWTLEGLGAKLKGLYTDLECNVTRIFGRRAIHLIADLTYHSVLSFEFDGRRIPGWVNSLIVGDSSQGKSETCIRLMEHYGVGERVDLKNATTAGLIGGLQQIGNRWFVSWGVIPTHDRRLVFLEEVKGASIETLSKMTDMRSSGIAEIPKIERRRAPARTRLCFISNPRSNRSMSAFNFGVQALKELVGALEDLRRFDIALALSASQVPADFINRVMQDRPTADHIHTADLCRHLVLFAWTRKPENVQFEEDAVGECFAASVRLCEKFSESLPLVDRGTMRLKLARLAVAMAIRSFSTDDTYVNVIVRKCHVEYVTALIDKIYSDPVMGYLDYSQAVDETNKVLDPALVEKQLRSVKYPSDFVRQLLHRDEITVVDIEDWCELDTDDARRILSFLVRKHCLYRNKRSYFKSPGFINLLKRVEGSLGETAEIDEDDEF